MKLFEKLFGPKKTLGELMLENKKIQEKKLLELNEKIANEQYWKFLEETKKSISKYRQDHVVFSKTSYHYLINDNVLFEDLKTQLAQENLEIVFENSVFLGKTLRVKPSKELT
jgi:hypothetical protein